MKENMFFVRTLIGCVLLILFSYSVAGQESEIVDMVKKLDSCKKVNYLEGELRMLHKIGVYYRNIGQYGTSDSLFLLALDRSKGNDAKVFEINSLNNLAINDNIQGRLHESIKKYEQALLLSEKLNDTVSMSNMCLNLGYVLKDAGRYREAMEYTFWAIDLRKRIKKLKRIPVLYESIATLFDKLGDEKKQGEYLRKAIKMIDDGVEIDDRQRVVIYNSIGNYYDNIEVYDSSLIYYQKVVTRSREFGWMIGEATGIGNLAMIYKKQGDIARAIQAHEEAIQLERAMNNKKGVIMELLSLSNLYLKQKGYARAEETAEAAFQQSDSLGFDREKMNSYQQLYRIYFEKDQCDSALQYFVLYKNLEDTLLKQEHQQYVSELDRKFQIKESKNQIVILEAENKLKNQRLNMVSLLVVALVLVLVLVVILMQVRKKHDVLQKDQLKQRLFRSQMNPHFIYNILGSIQALIYKDDSRKAVGYLTDFSRLSRNILESSADETVSLFDEISSVRSYVRLENLRKDQEVDFRVLMDDEMDAEMIFVPPMMIQPFLENALKHAYDDESGENELLLKVVEKSDRCDITIVDNGVGIYHKSKVEKKHKSMAMDIFKQRFDILKKGKYKNLQYQISDLKDSNQGNGTMIYFQLPIIE